MTLICGEGGIRTLGTVARTTVFETVPIDHSGTSPIRLYNDPWLRACTPPKPGTQMYYFSFKFAL